MTHVGIAVKVTSTGEDVYFDDTGSLAMVRGAEAVGQHIRQRLMTYQGECHLDLAAGVPWLAQIMGRPYDGALAEALVKAEIMDTDGVTEITSFAVSFKSIGDTKRGLNIRDVQVRTIYDEEAQV